MAKLDVLFDSGNIQDLTGGIVGSGTVLSMSSAPTRKDALLLDLPQASDLLDVQFTYDLDWSISRRGGPVLFTNSAMTEGYFIQFREADTYSIHIWRRTASGHSLLAASPIRARARDDMWRARASVNAAGVAVIQVFAKSSNGWVQVAGAVDDAYTSGGVGFSAINNGQTATFSAVSIRYDAAVLVSSPAPYQVFQRVGSSGTISISGTRRSGTVGGVEARWAGGAWTAMTNGAGDAFSGTIGAAAGQGDLELRAIGTTTVLETIPDVGIGDVYIVAGQSNAAGRFTNAQTYTDVLTASMVRRDGRWRALADPTGDSNNGSVWPLVADYIMAEEAVPVAFICVGEGSSNLFQQWSSGGIYYEQMIDVVAQSNVNGAKAILWYQGEADAAAGISQASYQTLLSNMLDAAQTAMGLGAVPLVAALIGENNGTAAQTDGIRAAIINRWENDTDILVGPVAHDQNQADGLHWTTDAQAVVLAARWWRCLYNHFYGGVGDTRGPRVSNVQRVASVIAVQFTGGSGNLQGADDANGWAYSGAAITSTSASGGSQVNINIASGVAGTLTWCSGNRTVTTTLRDSGTLAELPPEPFSAVVA